MHESASSTRDAASQTREVASEKRRQAADQARQVRSSVQSRVRQEVDVRSTAVGERMDAASQAMRSMGGELRSQGNDLPARLTEEAADRAERLGRYLREADADRMIFDVEDFARRRPWVVVAAGLAVGMAAARFLKASGQRRNGRRPPAARASSLETGG